ncbi:MAG: hypothetical protein JSW07_08875 [bacterium]|nr:MAG: hypothetical protein JSW07_08875 [bacterium]
MLEKVLVHPAHGIVSNVQQFVIVNFDVANELLEILNCSIRNPTWNNLMIFSNTDEQDAVNQNVHGFSIKLVTSIAIFCQVNIIDLCPAMKVALQMTSLFILFL